ncbi:hypothetical protein K2Z84_32010 [Candidatus Binatia bacterium]|nr:hypothetical protein [Candidatus Binatia bacterium]
MLKVDVLDARGAIAEPGKLEATGEAASFALGPLAIDVHSLVALGTAESADLGHAAAST